MSNLKRYNGTDWERVGTSPFVVMQKNVSNNNDTLFPFSDIYANTSGGAFTMNLPASSSVGDHIIIHDAQNTFGTYNLTLNRNGGLINGVADNLECDLSGAILNLRFKGSTIGWECVVESVSGLVSSVGSPDAKPYFHADKNGDNTQSITPDTDTLVTLPNVVLDTHNCFSNSRFTPTVAGMYLVNLSIRTGVGLADQKMVYSKIFKNGTQIYMTQLGTSGSSWPQPICNCLVYLNGTTDYIEAYFRHGDTVARVISGVTSVTYFQAVKVA